MEPSQTKSPAAAKSKPVSLLIGPITLPAYLDRSQIVTVAAGHELTVEEFNRWAEPLKDSFYRVLLDDLSLLLGSDELYSYHIDGSISADIQVIMDVTRFDSVPGGDTCLSVFWKVIGKDGHALMAKRKSVFRKAAGSQEMESIVTAQNQVLNQFAREIAAALQSLPR
jgi:uncharacterized lipoprotein YmbA